MNKNNKKSKTQQKIQNQWDSFHSYKDMSWRTGIEGKRLGEIRSGKVTPTRSEISKIGKYQVKQKQEKEGKLIDVQYLSRATGFSKDHILNKILGTKGSEKSPERNIVRMEIGEEKTVKLTREDGHTARVVFELHINFRTKEDRTSLYKSYDFNIGGNFSTKVDSEIDDTGKRYRVTITCYKIADKFNLKGEVEREVEKMLNGKYKDEMSIDSHLNNLYRMLEVE